MGRRQCYTIGKAIVIWKGSKEQYLAIRFVLHKKDLGAPEGDMAPVKQEEN
jgi:hypothetical protein